LLQRKLEAAAMTASGHQLPRRLLVRAAPDNPDKPRRTQKPRVSF
jgi:hypothetical protein